MSEDLQDARPAESSPAPDQSLNVPADALDTMSADELKTWRMTGHVPEAPVTDAAADSSPAEAVQEQPASTDAPLIAASEPAKVQKPGKGEAARIPELLADRAKERERAERAERRLAELEQQHRQPPPDVRPASSAAPAGTQALVEPDPETFPYGTADPAYVRAVAKFEAAAYGAQARTAWEQEQQQTRDRESRQRTVHAFEAKAAKARELHPDFDDVAMRAPTEIPVGSAADLWVMEDEAGAEILYHLQQPANAGERRRILALQPREQLKELVRLGDRLTAPVPAAHSTNAPPPTPTLSTRATPADPVERALAMGDAGTRAYMDAQNARELARYRK